MKKIIKTAIVSLAAASALVSCQKEFEYVFAEEGPDMTVESSSEAAYMGGRLTFSVNVSDSDFDLSTLKAQLLFDKDVVADTTIRTKTSGTYEGWLNVPFLKDIPDGNASLVFLAQNVGQAITADTVYVAVTRPEFEYLTLTTSDGTEYRMMPTGEKHTYAVEDDFPAQCNATIKTTPVPDTDNVLNFGWASGAVALDATGEIPFSYSQRGYTITFNTMTFEASPFVTIEVNGTTTTMTDSGNYQAVVSLTKGGTIEFSGYEQGFADWNLDPDYIEATDNPNMFTFLPMDGLYKITLDMANKYFLFEAMKSQTEYATLNEDGTGAVWLIGGTCVGKPTLAQSASWNPEAAGYSLAQVEKGIHQITLVAGVQLTTTNVDFKFFHQKTWGGEFGGGTITTDSPLLTIGESDGNIHLAEGVELENGGVYRFTLDLTNTTVDNSGSNMVMKGAVLSLEKVGEQEIPTENITVNGQPMEMVTAGNYTVTLDLEQHGALTVTGIDLMEFVTSYYLDPDYLTIGGTGASFNATSGKYRIDLSTSAKTVKFTKVKEDGSDATLAEGALWMLGWGVANPVMTSQIGFDEKKAWCLAEVEPLVFQFTGIAVEETDGTTLGGRFRYDYVSAKYFAQNAWGNEAGKIFGSENTIEVEGNAADYVKLSDSNNIELAEDLELGATYRLTIDLTKAESEGIEIVRFDKL